MAESVCPPWIGRLLASPIRRLQHNPAEILRPHVAAGMTVLEPGPGMGFFTTELARLVGLSGKVIAIDLQARMIEGLKRRARRAGLLDRIDGRIAATKGLGAGDLARTVDFALLFAMVHEVPNQDAFWAEVAGTLKPRGKVLFAEPSGHVSEADFAESLRRASAVGLSLAESLNIRGCIAALLLNRG